MIRKRKNFRRKTRFNSLYYPDGLDLKSKLSREDYKRYGDRLRFVLHYLYMCGCAFPLKKKRGWVVVHSSKWKKALSSHLYRRTLKLAEECGLIEIDDVYCPAGPRNNGRSKCYRLTTKYRRCPFSKVFVTSTQMKKYLRRHYKVSKRKVGEWLPVHDHLVRWMTRVRVSAAVGPLTSKSSSRTRQIINGGESGIHPRICKYGRFHSVLTRCPKEVRKGWEIGSQSLVEVDISNCQPLLMAWLVCALVEQSQQLNREFIHNSVNYCNTTIYTPYVDKNSVPAIVKPLMQKSLHPNDAANLLDLCENGQFYECFARQSGRQRDEVKEKLLIELYNTWSKEDRTLRKRKKKRGKKKTAHARKRVFLPIFRRLFPTAYRVCRHIKKGDFAKFPRLMQRIESYVIIEKVGERLMQEHAEVPVVTVHDAIFTTLAHVETVRRVIREVFGEVLGINVSFKGETKDPLRELEIDSSDAR